MGPRHAGAASGGQREDEAIAELNKRVAQLETEVTEIRGAFSGQEALPANFPYGAYSP